MLTMCRLTPGTGNTTRSKNGDRAGIDIPEAYSDDNLTRQR